MVRARRLLAFWLKLLRDSPPPAGYWAQCRPGGRAGPIQLFRSFLTHYHIRADTPTQWDITGRSFRVTGQHGLLGASLGAVQRVLWQPADNGHSLLQGLTDGRDLEASLGHRQISSDAAHLAFRDVLRGAAVYAPQLAHLRWGKDHHCPVCRGGHADWQHYVDACPHLPRGPALLPDAPGALRHTGNVPLSYNPRPRSLQIDHPYPWAPLPLMSDTVALVATTGGCRQIAGDPRAGWGLAYLNGDRLHGPVLGHHRAAQRGAVFAVLIELQRTQCRLHLPTDSRYVSDSLTRVLQGRTVACVQHGDL